MGWGTAKLCAMEVVMAVIPGTCIKSFRCVYVWVCMCVCTCVCVCVCVRQR